MAEQQVEGGAGARELGLERWVQFGFIVGVLAVFWLFDQLIAAIWNQFAEPDLTLVTALAGVSAVLLGVVLYKHSTVNRLAHEVANELSKVTWPTRKETSAATVVVIVTSFIAAIILFSFDAAWSSLTDIIYGARS